jgi:UPF0755 protein
MGGFFMIKKFLIVVVSIWLGIIITYGLVSSYYDKNVVQRPFKLSGEEHVVTINRGDTLFSVIDALDSDNKVKNLFLAKYYIRRNKVQVTIKPGSYTINKNTSLKDFFGIISSGAGESDPNDVMVTIPEGSDIERIAQILEENEVVSADSFIHGVKSYVLPDYIKADENRKYALEGYLFPDTYAFRKGSSGGAVIKTMLDRFEFIIKDIYGTDSIIPEELDKIIIMASIIEREIVRDEERATAASVFYNRLRIGMRLESCATVIYALGEHRDVLLYEDLRVNSPYNTYQVSSLPVGPISSPGRASIVAALNPSDTKYLYFVSRNDGSHEFNERYSDHLAASRRYQGGQ